MKKLIVMLLAVAAMSAQATEVIAHRGFWDTEGSAQNSIAALEKADSIGCYGSEFDVWMSADGELVVNHDATFRGVTMQDATAKVCTAVELPNGESLPTLRQYLERGKQLATRLILELKSHRTPERETEAVEKIVAMIDQLGLNERVEYIAFSRHATEEFIRLAPKGTPVYYLEGDIAPTELKAMGCAGADYNINVFKDHPEWIKECHDLGMKVNVWTVNKPSDMQWLIEMGVDFITTNAPVTLQTLLKR